jgi:hypothetical protein
MNQIDIREYLATEAVNQLAKRNYTWEGNRYKYYDAREIETGATIGHKTKFRDNAWVIHPRDFLEVQPFCFSCFNRSTDLWIVNETLHKFWLVPEEAMEPIRAWANETMGKHLAKHPKNDGIVLSEKKLKELIEGLPFTEHIVSHTISQAA